MSDPPIRVQGPVRRVAILTVGDEPCAAYLARRLRGSGIELALFRQRSLKVPEGSPAYFRRLRQRRGVRVWFDNLLLSWVKRALAGTVRALRRGRSAALSPGEAPRRAVDPDPGLDGEGWLRVVGVDDINRSPGRDRLTEFAPDLILLAGAPILRRKTIRIAKVACLNPHCGITPAYAGSSPIERAVFEGRFDEIGYTVHLVVPKVDGGPVIHQERVAWDTRRATSRLWPILATRMYDKLAETALALRSGSELSAWPQQGVRVNPPAGLFVRGMAELRRLLFAPRSGRPAV